MAKRSSFLWITDPWHTLDYPKDTSLRLMEEACRLEVQQYWCDVKTIRLESHQVYLDAKQLISIHPDRNQNSFQWGPSEIRTPSEFGILHYRPDPPVDLAYLHPLHLLDLDLRDAKRTEVVNPLEILFCNNEKIEAAYLKDLMPPSIVSSQWDKLSQFGKNQRRTVLKPLHQAQSQGIELLDWRKDETCQNAKMKLAIATQQFQIPVILQAYLEGIAEGETRLWFLDGKLLAHAKKLPITGDFRVDIDRGSKLAISPLLKSEKAIVPKIARHLVNRKIRLAAIDLIEGYITDFNFTSPGLIIQMESLLNQNLAQPIIKALLRA